MGPVTGGGVRPSATLNAEREVHAVPTGSPDGAVWSEPAVITCAGRQSATICARRRSGSVIASGTNVAPAHRHPSAATTKSTELPISRATRSPGSTPFCRNPAATLPAAARNSPRVNARSRSLTAGRSGARSAWSSTAPSTPWAVPSRRCCTLAILARRWSCSPRPRPWPPLIRPGEQRLLDPTLVNRLDVRVNRLDVRGSVIQDRIRDVLAAHGRMVVDPREVDSQADLYELGLTSHASVDVMLALEDAFDIEFPDEVLKKSTFASVRNIEQVVEGLVKSSA